MNMKPFCGELSFWCACIFHIFNLLCNIVLEKYIYITYQDIQGLSTSNLHAHPSINRLEKGKYTPAYFGPCQVKNSGNSEIFFRGF